MFTFWPKGLHHIHPCQTEEITNMWLDTHKTDNSFFRMNFNDKINISIEVFKDYNINKDCCFLEFSFEELLINSLCVHKYKKNIYKRNWAIWIS